MLQTYYEHVRGSTVCEQFRLDSVYLYLFVTPHVDRGPWGDSLVSLEEEAWAAQGEPVRGLWDLG